MAALRWVAPAILALVMAAAGGAKVAAPDRTRSSFKALGLPATAALTWAVPTAEIVTAVLLIAVPPVGATLALALLACFSAFLAVQILRGTNEPCACFGQVRPRPIATVDLFRNSALGLLAVACIIWAP